MVTNYQAGRHCTSLDLAWITLVLYLPKPASHRCIAVKTKEDLDGWADMCKRAYAYPVPQRGQRWPGRCWNAEGPRNPPAPRGCRLQPPGPRAGHPAASAACLLSSWPPGPSAAPPALPCKPILGFSSTAQATQQSTSKALIGALQLCSAASPPIRHRTSLCVPANHPNNGTLPVLVEHFAHELFGVSVGRICHGPVVLPHMPDIFDPQSPPLDQCLLYPTWSNVRS